VDRHFNDVMAWSQQAAYMPAWGNHEYENPAGEELGEERVAAVVRAYHDRPMKELVAELLASAREFGGTAAQADDITIVLIRRLPDAEP